MYRYAPIAVAMALAGTAALFNVAVAGTGANSGRARTVAKAVVETPADMDSRISALFEKWNSSSTPGCVVGVSVRGEPMFVHAYGQADLEHAVANRADTVFEAGSSSKQFTAAAVLTLVESGKLKLADDIRKFLPEMPDYGQIITVDALLHHTSGLRDWGAIEAVAGWPRTTRAYTMDDVLNIAARQRSLNFPPGSEYSYTNTGYNLLVLIVERVSGQSMSAYSHEHLFKPLGMLHTQWRDDFRRVVKNRAIAYEKASGGYAQNMPFEDAYGNGGLLTTVGDLLRWNDALTNGRLGKSVTSRLQERGVLSSGRSINYARGLIVGDYHGVEEVAHPGATAGYRAWLGRYPQSGLSIALLCNSTDVDTAAQAHHIADLFLPPRASSALRPVALSATTVAALSGRFLDESDGSLLILEGQGDHLRVKEGPLLEAVSPTEFHMEDVVISFEGTSSFKMRTEEGTGKYTRIKPYPPTTQDLSQLTGTYTSDEADATYVLSVAKGHLMMTLKSRPQTALMLAPADRDTFVADGALVRFRRASGGRVADLSLSTSRMSDLRFHRSEVSTGNAVK